MLPITDAGGLEMFMGPSTARRTAKAENVLGYHGIHVNIMSLEIKHRKGSVSSTKHSHAGGI